ncbi:MAG TPA: hypothetical protein V6C78_24860 [Crinalium sp.]|jgi:hypothetical protein
MLGRFAQNVRSFQAAQAIDQQPSSSATFSPVKVVLSLYGLLFTIFLGAVLQHHAPLRHLTRDPLAIVDKPFYFGAISQLGILVWCVGAASCLFGYIILKQLNPREKEFPRFFLWAGLLTATLMLDDLFMGHEMIFPRYLHISEKIIYVFYAIAFSLFLISFRKTILKTNFWILALVFVFFGMSIISDAAELGRHILPPALLKRDMHLLLEDGTKEFGILSWCTYFCITMVNRVCSSIRLAP